MLLHQSISLRPYFSYCTNISLLNSTGVSIFRHNYIKQSEASKDEEL
jgi:hypothetical protein